MHVDHGKSQSTDDKFTLVVALHFFVAGNRRHFKFGMWVEYSKFQPTDDKPSLK